MKILITGFDPFGGEAVNPAWEAVRRLPDEIAGARIVKRQIPTVFDRSIEAVRAAMEEHHPDAVVCVGLAAGRFGITPERVAINLNDARIPDNEGNQPIDTPVFADGPAAYFTSLPVKAMVEAIRGRGLAACLSTSAGTFVCNHVMYGLLYHIEWDCPGVRGGFIHVPSIPGQVPMANAPSMSLADIAEGLTAAVEAIVHTGEDLRVSGGSIC